MDNFSKLLSRWKEVIAISLIIKILLIIFTFLLDPGSNPIKHWVQWDGFIYLRIAEHSYLTSGEEALFIVFYPLYPIFIKIFSLFIRDFYTASILISIISSIIASITLFELVKLDFDKKVAHLSVWFMNIFPTAYFFQAGYTESLFLAVSLLSIYLFRKQKYTISGIFGALTTLTRVNGILLLSLFLLESKNFKKSLIALLLTLVGTALYLLINFFLFGDFLHFQKPLEQNWYKKFAWPWQGISNIIHSIPKVSDGNFYIYLSEIVAITFLILMTVIVFTKVRRSYGVYMLLSFLLFTSTSFILSTPRYALILFPIYIALAKIKNGFVISLLSLIFAFLLFTLAFLYTHGRWAY